MKIVTILGTRPELIRLCRIIPILDKYSNHVIVHTGQNFDFELDKIFFKSLNIRKPNYYLGAKGSFGNQIAIIFSKLEKILKKEKPDKFFVLGDTNSSMGAIIAKRLGIETYHLEAGNRCYDQRVPEEVNRKIIDHCSDILMSYTHRSASNLVYEGIKRNKIYVVGNPIYEVIKSFEKKINSSNVYKKFNIKNLDNIILVTLHRSENVDIKERLLNFVSAFEKLAKKYKKKIFWPIHPRAKINLKKYNIKLSEKIIVSKPINFFDFINIEKNCFFVLTDSGTVQEECAIFNKKNITIRDVTERPETIETGSNFISGDKPKDIIRGVELTINSEMSRCPDEYLFENVSTSVAKILLQKNYKTFN